MICAVPGRPDANRDRAWTHTHTPPTRDILLGQWKHYKKLSAFAGSVFVPVSATRSLTRADLSLVPTLIGPQPHQTQWLGGPQDRCGYVIYLWV